MVQEQGYTKIQESIINILTLPSHKIENSVLELSHVA